MKHYFGLDLLRFYAAISVVLYHISKFGGDAPSWRVRHLNAPLGYLDPIAWFGWVGVSIFFVLSGFIISASAESSTTGGFLRKRAIRILPALWISALLSLIIRVYSGEPVGEMLANFIRSIFLSPMGPYIDGVVWSLVVEAAFYILISGVIFISPRFGGMPRCLTIVAVWLGSLGTVFTLIQWMAIKSAAAGGAGWLAGLLARFAFDVLLMRAGAFFAVGMLLFQMTQRRARPGILLAVAVFSIASCLQIVIAAKSGHNVAIPILVWMATTIFTYASVKYGETLFSGDFWKFTRPVGLMTYPLYLNHFVLGQALIPLLVSWIPNRIALLVAALAIILGNAWFISRFPERWLQTWARALAFRRPATLAASTP